ncbi:MAG: hypothetical protein P8L66_02980 [Rhodospirillaceae bacterium]|nr:hypothetical protein [Rhodospirillaceae bacterium]
MTWHDLRHPKEMNLLVGTYDFPGYAKYCRTIPTRTVFELLSGYFEFTVGIIPEGDGRLAKAISNVSLIAFLADEALGSGSGNK